MTSEQITSLVRILCNLAGSSLITAGVLTSDQVGTLTAAMLALAGAVPIVIAGVASWRAHSHQGILASAATIQGTQIVTQPALANAVPAQNVVSSDDAKVVPAGSVAGLAASIPGGH